MRHEPLDRWCEYGILGLVLAALVYSPLAFGGVPQEGFDFFVVVQWITVAVIALWLVRFYVNPKHRLLWPPASWAVLVFLGYAVVRYFTSEVEFLARQELVKVLVYGVLYFAIVNNLHRQEMTQRIGVVVIFTGMLISLYALYQFIAASDFVWHIEKPEGYRKRGSGTFICPNHLAGYLEMILPLSIAFTLTGRFEAMMKIFLGYATMVILAGLAATVSRGGLLATAVALALVALWLLRQRDYWQRGVLVVVIALAILGGFYWKADIGPERRERIDIARQVEDVRFQLWKPAVAMWKDHALLGVGLNHFDTRFRAYRPADPALQARPERVHNDYLNTLVDWGIVGAALVLACWGMLAWQVSRVWKYVQRSSNDLGAKRSNKAAFVAAGSIGLVAILVHSFFDFNMHIPSNALLAVTIFAIVSSHYRFAGEGSWHTVRLPLRIPVTLLLVAAIGFLGFQAWLRTSESIPLAAAHRAAANSDEQLAALQRAHAVEGRNFDTTTAIGAVYLERSQQGAEGYQELAGQAIQWFGHGAQLNPYDPHGWIGKGRALDWLGKHDEAAASFEKAEALDPNGYHTAAYLGWHYFQISNYDVAKQWLEKSRTLMSDAKANPIPHSYLKEISQRLAPPVPR